MAGKTIDERLDVVEEQILAVQSVIGAMRHLLWEFHGVVAVFMEKVAGMSASHAEKESGIGRCPTEGPSDLPATDSGSRSLDLARSVDLVVDLVADPRVRRLEMSISSREVKLHTVGNKEVKTRVLGAAKKNQLGKRSHIVDQIGKIADNAAVRIYEHEKDDVAVTKSPKKMKETTFVKDRGKPRRRVGRSLRPQQRRRRAAARNYESCRWKQGPPKSSTRQGKIARCEPGEGCETAWSRRVAMRWRWLATITKHGPVDDKICKNLREREAAISPSSTTKARRKKNVVKTTSFVKDRGKSSTSQRWRSRPQCIGCKRSSVKKRMKQAASVNDRRKLYTAHRDYGRSKSETPIRIARSNKKTRSGFDKA